MSKRSGRRQEMMDLYKLDLKMLHCLHVLVDEAHVTRAAERLNMSQPRLSSTLSRLRRILGDPLLVRTVEGMRPTASALEIAEHVRCFLESVQGTLDKRTDFDVGTANRTFNIVAEDVLVQLYLSFFIGDLRREAPGIVVSLSLPPISEIIESLQTGDIDLAMAFISSVPDDFYVTKLLEVDRVCIASMHHPRIRGTLSVEEFAANDHVVVTLGQSYLPTISEQMLDEALQTHGLMRNVAVFVEGVLSVSEIVMRSDLLAVVPKELALLKRSHLQIFPLPFACPTPEISLIWHKRAHNDTAHRWLRTALKRLSLREHDTKA